MSSDRRSIKYTLVGVDGKSECRRTRGRTKTVRSLKKHEESEGSKIPVERLAVCSGDKILADDDRVQPGAVLHLVKLHKDDVAEKAAQERRETEGDADLTRVGDDDEDEDISFFFGDSFCEDQATAEEQVPPPLDDADLFVGDEATAEEKLSPGEIDRSGELDGTGDAEAQMAEVKDMPIRLQEDAGGLPAEETAEPAEAATPEQGNDVFDKDDVAEQGRPEAENDADLTGVDDDHDDLSFYKPIRLQEDADGLPAEEETAERAEAATPEQGKDVFDKVSCFFWLEPLLLLVIASIEIWVSPWMGLAIFLVAIGDFVKHVIMYRCLQHRITHLREGFCRISTASEMLAKCLPKHVVRILRSGNEKAMRRVSQTYRERKYGTTLVSDIAGFTSISEELKKHSLTNWTWSVQLLLDRYLHLMGGIVEHFGGEVDKVEGDGLSAFFSGKHHAEKAYEAAKAMQDTLRQFNVELYNLLLDPGAKLAHGDAVDLYLKNLKVLIRIGLYTGYVHEGNFGSIDAMKCGVIGEAMIEAAKLEDRCKHYDTNILASQTHVDLLPEELQASLEKIDESGKEPIYKLRT